MDFKFQLQIKWKEETAEPNPTERNSLSPSFTWLSMHCKYDLEEGSFVAGELQNKNLSVG
jgi:hypothetical protein